MVTENAKKIPIFMGHGTSDTLVRHSWGEKSKDLLLEMEQEVTWKSYPGLGHSATPQEISDMEQWIEERLKANPANSA